MLKAVHGPVQTGRPKSSHCSFHLCFCNQLRYESGKSTEVHRPSLRLRNSGGDANSLAAPEPQTVPEVWGWGFEAGGGGVGGGVVKVGVKGVGVG